MSTAGSSLSYHFLMMTRAFLWAEYSSTEKGFGIETVQPVVIIKKKVLKPLQEVKVPGPLSTIQITMSDQTRALLQSWLRRPTMPSGMIRRARALLLLEQGKR
jgi:hypothetical protein